jgi:hypothetical protein
MFVRFRTPARRLQVSLIANHRSAGKVCHEHIAGLGSGGRMWYGRRPPRSMPSRAKVS